MTERSLTTRPLVTFALIAYNQEKYIREAVEGAFSQSYEPLEIILSDDNSTDRTSEIISELVDQYQGPHRIKLMRQERNLGLAFHVNHVLEASQGEYIVLAAGDDISEPQRTQTSVDKLTESSALLFHSGILPVGGKLQFNFSELNLLMDARLEDSVDAQKFYIGATGVISRQLFEKYGPLPYGDIYEDQIFGFRARLEGKFCFSEEKLVQYRVNSGISGGSKTAVRGFMEYRKRRLSDIQRNLHTNQARLADLLKSPCAGSLSLISAMKQTIRSLENRQLAVKSPIRGIASGNVVLTLLEALASIRVVARSYFRRISPGNA